jgi:hypothetical protein
MSTRHPRQGTHPRTAARLRRLAAVLATATSALLALALASPAMAMTMSRPHYLPPLPAARFRPPPSA